MTRRLIAISLTALLLAACQRESEPAATAPAPEPAPAGVEPAAPPPESTPDITAPGVPARDTSIVDASVSAITLSNVGDPEARTIGMPTQRFAGHDTVYALVETTGTATGYNVYAKWMAGDGSTLSDYGMRVSEAGPVRTVISLSKPDGWAPGRYMIEVAINGKVEQTVEFQVQ